MTPSNRLERMRTVLDGRLAHVHCAVEAVYHRHNVSAILRTCDALGLHNVHLVPGAFTASRGTARGAERWLDLHPHESAQAAIAAIRAAGCKLWIADLGDAALPPEDVPVDRPVCVWFGAELAGVSEDARAAADGIVTVPMRGFAQSLNVSVAAALALRPIAERARALGPRALLTPATQQVTWDRWMERHEALRAGIADRGSLR